MTLLRYILAPLFCIVFWAQFLVPLAYAEPDDSPDSKDSKQGDISESDCASLDESLAGVLGCDSSDEVKDFVELDGKLAGPDAEGYDSALTQNENARDFIKQIVNYALGFLALITTVIIIYGGLMYVMSRGDEEMATKGKKAITYSAIGILIILGSFAIVNTLIGAGGGELNGGSSGDNGGTTISETGAAFDVDEVLGELEDIATEYVAVYKTYLAVSEEVEYMKSQEIPIIVYVSEKDYTAAGFVEYATEWVTKTDDDFADQYVMVNQNSVNDYVDTLRSEVQRIQLSVDSLSDTYEAAQDLYNYLESATEVYAERTDSENKKLGCAVMDYDAMQKYWEISFGVTISKTDIEEVDPNICTYIVPIQEAADADYEEQVMALIEGFRDLKILFDADDQGYSSGSQLTQISEAMESIVTTYAGSNQGVLQRVQDPADIGATSVRDVVNAINELYLLIEDIGFVQVQLTASATRGNAPLIVRFNALGTEDPSGLTVNDGQIEWDLNGDGSFAETIAGSIESSDSGGGGVEADEIFGDAVSATFTDPGTYRVRLRVQSRDENTAAGVATVTIEVEPAKSKIVLNATAGGETTILADFREFPEINKNSYKVTMTEAIEGITFEAGETTDGDGNTGPSGIVNYEWDFGDNDDSAGQYGEDGGSFVKHSYGEEGTYNVSLTVTDDTGVKDRKLLTLYVASPAARVTSSPASGPVGTTFFFDGSGSSTDGGSIVSYQWSATLDGVDVPLETTTGQTMEAVFTEPGLYSVTLQVADNNKNDSASVSVLVASTAPVATYDYSVPQSTEPATLIFDATDSSDPDAGDTITYEWDFDGTEGTEYTILEKASDLSSLTVQFLEVGDYDVSLTVYDQHEGELKKSDTATGTITIDSVLDVDLEIEGDTARHLDDNGEAPVEFKALSEKATAFEMDFGDGETSATDTISSGQSIFTHTYTTAGVYAVTLTAFDDQNDSNVVSGRVFVGAGDAPIAVIGVGSENEDIGSGASLYGNIKTKFSFDASESVNVDGSRDSLEYSWNFGDGVTSAQKSVTHIFEEVATYTVTLTVRDQDDNSITDETTVKISIRGIDPTIQGISVVPQSSTLETPLKVDVSVDAVDEDGKITYTKGWYYDLNDTATELGTVISESTNFSLTINTKGLTGDVLEYGFAAEVTDNDNNTVASYDELSEDAIPVLEVTNGPNETPVASFTTDKTSIYLGEEISFFGTSSYDPDGSIVRYWWDIEGDGFYNNDPQENGSLTYSFTQVHPEGIDVQLKVEDDAGATAVSDSITIYIDAVSDAPDAAFLTDVNGKTVQFRNNSTIDTKNGAKLSGIYWDFDLATDSNGNGVANDDFDSFDEEPSYTYPALSTYQVSMTVVDNTGQTDSVTQTVSVLETSAPTAAFSYEVEDLSVSFENESTFDESNGITGRAYNWDFDLDADSDGDTDPENDTDAITKNPTYVYENYGTYEVKMTVEDTVGKTDTVLQTVKVPNPMPLLVALLVSTPTPNSLDQVVLENDGEYVTFFYGAEGGNGSYTYEIDKNIFYDTDGDGIRDNDKDYADDSSGSWKTPFYTSYGQIVVKLTVTDDETGDTDIETLQVVFEGSMGGANLFNATPSQMLFLILGALLATILGISMSFKYTPLARIK